MACGASGTSCRWAQGHGDVTPRSLHVLPVHIVAQPEVACLASIGLSLPCYMQAWSNVQVLRTNDAPVSGVATLMLTLPAGCTSRAGVGAEVGTDTASPGGAHDSEGHSCMPPRGKAHHGTGMGHGGMDGNAACCMPTTNQRYPGVHASGASPPWAQAHDPLTWRGWATHTVRPIHTCTCACTCILPRTTTNRVGGDATIITVTIATTTPTSLLPIAVPWATNAGITVVLDSPSTPAAGPGARLIGKPPRRVLARWV